MNLNHFWSPLYGEDYLIIVFQRLHLVFFLNEVY